MNQIRKEERQFLSDLELLLGKPIPNLDNTDSIDVWSEWPVQPNMESWENLPKSLQEMAKNRQTDRYDQPIKRERMGYHVRDGHLKRLILKGLKYIPESIGNLSHLENLNVDCFHLKILPDSILNLNSLRILSLMECANLQTIPEEIGLLINLEELHLTGFDSQIPESIGNLENLKILNIFSMSKLKNLPESMGNLKSLEILQFIGDSNCSINLRNIPIKELPRSIRRLKSLKVLNLMGCKSLEWIPEELSELESLETLNLGEYDKELILIVKGGHPIHSWSEIRSLNRKAILLPKNFGNLKNLKHLTLSFWKNLKSLPESIGQLDSLEVLNLCYCDSLNSLPKSMRNLKKLKISI